MLSLLQNQHQNTSYAGQPQDQQMLCFGAGFGVSLCWFFQQGCQGGLQPPSAVSFGIQLSLKPGPIVLRFLGQIEKLRVAFCYGQ